MFYLVLLCILLLAVGLLPGIIQTIITVRELRRAPPLPPPRGCRLVVIEGGKREVRNMS